MRLRLALLPIALLGCVEARPQAPGNTVRDSAGVRIVESTADARYPVPWDLGDAPVWSVGRVEGSPEYLLDAVVGAIQLPDGTILVANRGTNELRFYDADGGFIKSEGREGQGPGEYEYLRGLGPCVEGGFVAFDLNWQMNAYTWDGTFIDKTVLRAPEGVTPYNVACDPHGHVLLMGWGVALSGPPQIGFYQAHARLLLTDHDGNVEVDFGERLASERIGTSGGSRPHPAGRATQFALHDDRVFMGSGESFQIEVRDLSNGLQRLLRGPAIDLDVDDDVRAAYLDAELARVSEDRRPELRRTIEEWAWPEGVPAFVELRVDAAGIVWALAFTTDRDAAELWSLFDEEEGYIGDLQLPPRHSLLEAGADYLLLRAADELDVQRVVELPLVRGPLE